MHYFSWNPSADLDATGRPNPNLLVYEPSLPPDLHWWDLIAGSYIDKWEVIVTAEFDEDVSPTDFPLASFSIPIYSPRLRGLIEQMSVGQIQFLPLQLRGRQSGRVLEGYCIANYLCVLDCLDRKRSHYEVWTKDSLMFWEKRPWMLGTFRSVDKVVLDAEQIAGSRLFRIWGWNMVVVREDVKQAIEDAGLTGSSFKEIEAI